MSDVSSRWTDLIVRKGRISESSHRLGNDLTMQDVSNPPPVSNDLNGPLQTLTEDRDAVVQLSQNGR